MKKRIVFQNAALLVALSLGWACGTGISNPDESLVSDKTSCDLPKSQGADSFAGSWNSIPVPIAFDNDFYVTNGGSALESLKAAVSSWNSWAGYKGKQALSLNSDGSGVTAGRTIPTLTDCVQTSYTSAVTDVVGIWKISSSGLHANQRDSCGTNGKLLATGVQGQTEWVISGGHITGASILLNFEGFNAPGKVSIDVESLLLHELGHVLGLLHSCNPGSGSDSTSSPSCDSPNTPNSFKIAVMHPFLSSGQKRRTLGQNDFNRINCLY